MHKLSNLIEIYESKGETRIEVRFEKDSVWLSLNQLSELFGRDKSVISRHLRKIYDDKELVYSATVAKNATVQIEGSRKVSREIDFYNLDAIISVGYRVNSKRGTQFRIWATQRLKEHLVNGFTINQERLQQTNQEIQILRSGIQIIGRAIETKAQEEGLEWLSYFSEGLTLLDDYDHESLDINGKTTKATVYPSKDDYQILIDQMRQEFHSDVFGREKDKGFDSAISQISKGFGDVDFYPSLEEKAAMLLYLIIKNHAFADGNKRIGVACFLLFLKENKLLSNSNLQPIISNDALASVTLFIAASKPDEMETVKRLVISILNRNKN